MKAPWRLVRTKKADRAQECGYGAHICERPVTDIVDDGVRLQRMCHMHRVRLYGLARGERGWETRRFRARQIDLFAAESSGIAITEKPGDL